MGIWSELLWNPIIVVIAFVIGTLGEIAKRAVKAKAGDKGWRGVYYVTLPAHPVLVGALVGLIPWLPIPEALTKEGFEFAGRLATGLLGGILCKIGYDILVSTAKRMLGQGAARESNPPDGR
jgi:hypothetical protein